MIADCFNFYPEASVGSMMLLVSRAGQSTPASPHRRMKNVSLKREFAMAPQGAIKTVVTKIISALTDWYISDFVVWTTVAIWL